MHYVPLLQTNLCLDGRTHDVQCHHTQSRMYCDMLIPGHRLISPQFVQVNPSVKRSFALTPYAAYEMSATFKFEFVVSVDDFKPHFVFHIYISVGTTGTRFIC